nr:hypothetical protein [Glycomyces amatae]
MLAELIAQLTALIEQNRQAEAALVAAHDRMKEALSSIRASTVGSSNPLVADGLVQWESALEKLAEVHGLMSAGDQAMTDYISGPLLGGTVSTAGGTGDGPSSGTPRSPSPVHAVTRPAHPPDPGRRPAGPPTALDGTKSRALERENESAIVLARAGYDIEQNPPTASEKDPDYRTQGELWDCYAPKTNKPKNIRTAMRDKVHDKQAFRIILNLDDCEASPAEIRARLEHDPIRGLEEIKIVYNDQVTQFFPWDSEIN